MVERTRQVHIDGLKEFKKMAENIAPRRARTLARSAVHAVAGEVRDEMRRKAPKDQGTLRKAIHSKRRRGSPVEAVSDVRISHGRNAKHDAWYWHMIEFGTTKASAQPFIRPTVDKLQSQMTQMFREHFGKRLEKELNKEAKKQGAGKR